MQIVKQMKMSRFQQYSLWTALLKTTEGREGRRRQEASHGLPGRLDSQLAAAALLSQKCQPIALNSEMTLNHASCRLISANA